MPFSIQKIENINEVLLKVIGSLDESGMLPLEPHCSVLRLDLTKLQSISSIGIRNFIFWGDKHLKVKVIRLENCPSIFVKNFNMISGFLKPNMSLISFLVPFYSSKTQEQKDILFVRDREFTVGGPLRIPQVKDSAGHPMDLDVDIKTFFSFLKPIR